MAGSSISWDIKQSMEQIAVVRLAKNDRSHSSEFITWPLGLQRELKVGQPQGLLKFLEKCCPDEDRIRANQIIPVP